MSNIDVEIERLVRRMIEQHPMVINLQIEAADLRTRLDQLEKCCICSKVNRPIEKIEE